MKEFFVNGKKVKAVKMGRDMWLHCEGKTYLYSPQLASQKMAASEGDLGPVLSPMPGKIIKVFVQKGEKVKAGKLLLVMEAMKMEYSMKAPKEAVVSEISCIAEQQVSEGESLLVLSEPKE